MMDDEVVTGLPITLPDGETSTIRKSEEWLGPQLVPEQYVDEKFIPISFKISLREPEGLPNYRQIIKSLP
nr:MULTISPECIES: hypothetical protein [Mycobacteroides]